jgi:hypothetical protein
LTHAPRDLLAAPLPQVLALNRRVQAQNRAPAEFPAFVRQGFDILVIADDYQETADGSAVMALARLFSGGGDEQGLGVGE